MKRTVNYFCLLGIGLMLLSSCAPSIRITGTWTNKKQDLKDYKSFLVLALTGNVIAKSTLEADLSAALQKRGFRAEKGLDALAPSFSRDSLDRQRVKEVMDEKKLDAILSVSIIKRETDYRYIPGRCVSYSPMMYVHYHHFWGYYTYWAPCIYSPGYYEKDEVYYLECNLYDGATNEMMWSAQSETYYPVSLPTVSKDFSSLIVERLIKDGVLRGGAASYAAKPQASAKP